MESLVVLSFFGEQVLESLDGVLSQPVALGVVRVRDLVLDAFLFAPSRELSPVARTGVGPEDTGVAKNAEELLKVSEDGGGASGPKYMYERESTEPVYRDHEMLAIELEEIGADLLEWRSGGAGCKRF